MDHLADRLDRHLEDSLERPDFGRHRHNIDRRRCRVVRYFFMVGNIENNQSTQG